MTSTFFPRFKFPSVRLAGLVLPALPSPQSLSQLLLPHLTPEGAADAPAVRWAERWLQPRGDWLSALGDEGVASAWRGRERAAR